MKIVIFGLTGDPVTSAHMEIINSLSVRFDKVIVVPTNINYYKNYKGHDRAMLSFTERYESLVDRCRNIKNVEVSDIERDIKDGWKFVHTLKTLIYKTHNSTLPVEEVSNYDTDKVLRMINDLHANEYYIAMGSDSFQNFNTWYDYKDIYRLAKLVVFTRPGYPMPTDSPFEAQKIEMNNSISSTKVRQNIMALLEKASPIIESDDFDTWIDDLTWAKELFEDPEINEP